MLEAAKQAGVDIRKYNLPADSEKLHDEINLLLDKFEKLVSDLKGESKMIKTLEKSVKELEMK